MYVVKFFLYFRVIFDNVLISGSLFILSYLNIRMVLCPVTRAIHRALTPRKVKVIFYIQHSLISETASLFGRFQGVPCLSFW